MTRDKLTVSSAGLLEVNKGNLDYLPTHIGLANKRMAEKGVFLDDGIYCGPLDGNPDITYKIVDPETGTCRYAAIGYNSESRNQEVVVRIYKSTTDESLSDLEIELPIAMEHLEAVIAMQLVWEDNKRRRSAPLSEDLT